MNLRFLFRQSVTLLACMGVLAFAAGRLSAAEHETPAQPAAAVAGHSAAAGTAHAEVAPAAAPAHSAAAHAEPGLVQKFAFSYLVAFLFCLSLMLGGLVFVIFHHLFDAGWSVPVVRLAEHLACLSKILLVAAIPLLLLQGEIWRWIELNPAYDHSLNVKKVLLNRVSFNVLIVVSFALWIWMSHAFRRYSLAQDKDGSAIWTRKARRLAAGGIYIFAFSLTLVIILLMMSLQWQFYSTIYGVYYFAGSFWLTLATLYGLARWLATRELRPVIFPTTIHYLGTLFFAFTVFYAYIAFSQYFLIWNAALPEETFWYVLREKGSWWQVGLLLLFGHFFVPFLLLLRIDTKMSLLVMGPMIAWAWLMHYVDVTFNVMPILYPDGLHITLFDPLCWFGLAAILAKFFWADYLKYPKWPQKHPRLKEAITHHEVPAPGSAPATH